MSLSTDPPLFDGICDFVLSFTSAMTAAIETLRSNGVITFASAGNDGANQMPIPACLSNVVSVGASNDFDIAASFSNSNSLTDLFAPGVNIVSSHLSGTISSLSGTSMSSPHAGK